ncbi:terminase gpA endonuclease subunit [Sphingomonas sp. SRS2]|uniref:terminase gpA endonuclease subunit n=1 Tax=Sphingomonas sp. SRS2 TaxID=133190 RepID=UPI000B0F1F64|nr:terminase gpA endonuclease subunit [Sphingomonas sp. SRS2]
MTVSEWAIEHRSYDPEVAPWQPEIMDALSDPETAEVGLMAPAQAGKSEIGLGWMGWSVEHDPAGFMICQPSKSLMQDFVVRRVAPMIQQTPVVKAQLLPEIGADNIFLKQFRAMLLTSIWPVASEFRARPVPRGWLDDFDAIPDDIEGQGSAPTLLDARATWFEGRDKKFISSSPAREDGGGVEAFVAQGTDERLRPICPSCDERIELDIRRDLKFDDKGTAEQAEASAHVICPANGCILQPDDRRRLLESLIGLPNRGFVQTNMKVGRRRRGFRVDGLLNVTSWPKLALEWRNAQIAWEARQDEAPLIGFFNSRGGQNYRSQLAGEKPLTIDELGARREAGWKIGTVPGGVKVILLLVDVQHNRFECAAVGVGEGNETWLIDRWAIETLNDGLTGLQPLKYREHWAALLPLFSRTWPLADGSGQSPPPLSVAVDARGGESDLPTGFWHMCVAAGIHQQRVTLLQGGNNPKAELISRARRSDQKTRGGVKRNSPARWTVNVHKLKNILDARIRREQPGPGYIHLPHGLADQYLDELTAEEKQKGKWVKIRPRNETLDLLVQSIATLMRPPFAGTRTHMRWVPAEYRVPEQDLESFMAARNDDGPQPAALDSASIKPSASGAIDETARDRPDGQGRGAEGGTRAVSAPAAQKKKRRGVNKLTGRATGSWLKRN